MNAPVQLRAERHLGHILRTRAMRGEFFEQGLFADPVWDLLLSLYEAELKQWRVTVSVCCNAANVPPTTALRHIRTLCDRGLVLRKPDPLDARRVFLSLAPSASDAMRSFLDAFSDLAARDATFQPHWVGLDQPRS